MDLGQVRAINVLRKGTELGFNLLEFLAFGLAGVSLYVYLMLF